MDLRAFFSRSQKSRPHIGLKPRTTSAGFAKRISTPEHSRQEEKKYFKIIAISIIFLLSAAGWYFLPETKHPSQSQSQIQNRSQNQNTAWENCLLPENNTVVAQEEPLQPILTPIPSGTYTLPSRTSELFAFLGPYEIKEVIIDQPFLIQDRKMAQPFFKRYVNFVEALPDGEEKERHRAHIGLLWNQSSTPTTRLQGASWEAAIDFTHWLSQKTGCSYTIPSREQWLAAIIYLYSMGEQAPKPGSPFNTTPLGDLLRGGREWTQTPCPLGYYLVGEENWVSGADTGQPVCIPPLFAIAGFRVVLNPTPP